MQTVSRDPESFAGWHYATREPIEVSCHHGLITEVCTAAKPPPENQWLAPGLVDLQVNGYAGVDFQRDDITAADLECAIRQLHADGCGRILLTLITDEWTQLVARLQRLSTLRSNSAILRRAIAGWHIEGPFLSPEPGYHGAHDPRLMRDPTPAQIDELREAAGSAPMLLTVAPERTGAIDAIRHAAACGIKISLGHTNASASVIRDAVAAGAGGFTHLGNACPQQLDRHDNILWRVLDTPGLRAGLIADGMHVSPPFFRLVHRVLTPDAIYYTTDAMAAAGAAPGRYTIGALELEVGADGVVRQPGKTNFAGSALRPIEGIRRAARMLGRTWNEVWDSFSVIPSRWMGLPSGIELGAPAPVSIQCNSAGLPEIVIPQQIV